MRGFALTGTEYFFAVARNAAAAIALLLLSALPAAAALIVNPSSLPAGTLGESYDSTFTASGGTGPYTFAVTTGTLPPGLTLNGSSGQLTGMPSTQGVYNFTITATDSLSDTGSRAYTMSVGTFSLAVQPNTLPNTTLGAAYNQTLTAVGGDPPYTFVVSSGSLPTGLSLATNGAITGTASAGGSFTFIVRADDEDGNTGYRTYTVSVGTNSLTIAPPTLPNGTQGVGYNQTVTASGGTGGPYAYSVTSGALPTGLSLNASTGQISGTPSAGGSFTFTIRAVDGNNNFGTRSYTVYIASNALVINPASLPNGTLSTPYSQTVTATGGTGGPYTYSIGAGSLPPGLSLNAGSGAITGTPSAGGSYSFTVHAVDGNNDFGDRSYTVSIGTTSLTVNPSTLPNGTEGVSYSQTVTPSGGTAPYTFAVSSGALPNGLSLDANTGAITGTPTLAGGFSFTVTATDIGANTGSRAYTVNIAAPPLVIAPSTLPNGTQGIAYSQTVTASGGTGPYTYAVLSGALPTGLSLNASSGAITGTPTSAGSYSFTIQATDSVSTTGSRAYTVSIGASGSLALNPSSLPNGTQGVAYSQTVTASGGTAPYTYAVLSGALPTGLSLNASSGAITGTPTSAGSYSFTIQAIDANSNAGSRAYTVSIGTGGALTLNPSSLPSGTIFVAYSQTVTASGGTGPYTYAVSAGALPAGLSLNASTGAITGTPSSAGSYSFTVEATDTNGNTGSRAYTVSIGVGFTLGINPASLPNGTQGVSYSQTVTASGGTAPYTFAVSAGALPAGLSLNSSTGAITGTPSGGGVSNFSLQATDANGNMGVRGYTVSIGTSGALTVNPSTLPNGTQGVAYSQTVTASGGTAPYSYSISSGALPTGLSLNTSTGAITGTPSGSGVSNFTIEATDANGNTGTRAYAVNIVTNSVTVGPSSLPNPTQGASYSQTLTASGGTAPYTFALTSGTLPPGLVLNASTGAITGTSTGLGSYTFTVQATDANGNFGTRSYTLSTTRLDPANDPDVRGLVASQAATARRFTDAQSSNVQRRLEALHDEFSPCGLRMGITVTTNDAESGIPTGRGANADMPPQYGDSYMAPVQPAPRPSPWSGCNRSSRSPVAAWANGAVDFGNAESAGSTPLDFSTSGITAGIDARLSRQFVVGAAMGYGLDHTDVGLRGTTSEADNFSGMLYASYQPLESLFIDAVIGHGLFSFDNTRRAALGNGTLKGQRDGNSTFGSATVSFEARQGDFKFAPYLQLSAMTAKLDAYGETGSPGEALSYDGTAFSSIAGGIGLRGSVDIVRGVRTFTPHMRVEYKRAFDSSFSQSLYYSDTGPGSSYAINQPDAARDVFSGVIGVRTVVGYGSKLDVEYGVSGDPTSEASSVSQTLRASVNWNLR